ncbi:MAG: hypothetical protein WA061_01670 [Microgenomates group bacterium]
MLKLKDFELYVDDDGYVCFTQENGNIWWTLHYGGWEAFFPYEDNPRYGNDDVTFPADDELEEVKNLYKLWLDLKENK